VSELAEPGRRSRSARREPPCREPGRAHESCQLDGLCHLGADAGHPGPTRLPQPALGYVAEGQEGPFGIVFWAEGADLRAMDSWFQQYQPAGTPIT